MKKAPNPREVIGNKRFRCDTKEGKKCEPLVRPSYYLGNDVRCKHCSLIMRKARGG